MKHSILIAAAILILMMHPNKNSEAQNTDVNISSSIRWSIPRAVCGDVEYCGVYARLSVDQQKLYLLVFESLQLFIYDADTVNEYRLPIPSYPFSDQFDFIPYGEEEIIYFDSEGVFRYNFVTGTTTEIVSDVSLRTCSSTSNPPWRSFMRFGSTDYLLVCGLGSTNQSFALSEGQIVFNISAINLRTEAIHEIDAMVGIPGRMNPWYRVTAGQDGYVYLQPIENAFMHSIISDFDTRVQSTGFVLRHGLENAQWEIIEIPQQNLSRWGISGLGELVSIDRDANMYFYAYWYITSAQSPTAQYTKINSDGNIEWVFDNLAVSGTPSLMDVMPNGDLLMLEYFPSGDIVFEVRQYSITSTSG